MGNNLSTTGTGPGSSTSAARQTNGAGSGADSILGELGGEVQYDKSMGTSRFLKTIRGRHKQGALVVKVFIKADPSVSLKAFHRRVKAEREALADCPNVLPYQRAIETERAGYLIRQWTASNLYDRISTRPFLSLMEKRWIAFQLLTGLQSARERNISHGDIKTENVGVSSWNWVYLTDFASFKPTYLPLDDPSTFSFFFDTSSRRTCYLAPERFYAPDSEMAKRKEGLEFGKKDGKVTEAMDVFALGCVFAELWMEGTPPFTLSQLFKYREGQYSPEPYLAEIEDVEIRALIRSMLSLDPAHRLSCAEYLASYRTTAFPDIFYTFLHPFISSLNDISPSLPPPTPNASLAGKMGGAATPGGQSGDQQQQQQATLRSDADERVERVWSEWEMISEYLERGRKGKRGEESAGDAQETSEARGEEDIFPLRLHIPGFEGQPVSGGAAEDGPALIILSLICSNIRNCVRPTSIIRALDVLLALNRYLTDETKLDRLVPYLVTILQDEVAYVRSAAIKALTQTLLLITTLTPSNASLFPEYIFPNTRPFSTDPELLPRTTYAQCIAALATQSKRFLEMTEAMKTEGTFKLANVHEFGGEPFDENFDTRLLELQIQVSDHLSPLLSDSSSVVKRALLTHVGTLCTFFGPARANDAILAHLVTYLNTRDWLLRAKWNEVAIEVAACVGSRSLEEYILPLITMSLADAEEFVVVKVLATLTTLTERRFLTKGKTWELVAQITGFLCHPNIWIREGTAAFLASTAKRLSPTDCWCILYPTIKRLLRADIKEITELALLDNAREPLPRVIFEAAVAWAGRSGKSNFWSLPRGSAKGAPRDAGVRTDEDHAQLEKMRQLGMKPEDEFKLSMMREYISKLAISRQAAPSRLYDASDALTQSGGAQLQDLGIVPQTIFFSIRSADELSNEVSREAYALQQRPDGIPRRFSLDPTPRSPGSLDIARPASSRNVSGGQPIEDLRRRLALAGGGSTTSLNSGALETASVAASEDAQSTTGGKTPIPERLELQRTTSHASTDVSDTTTSTRGADIVAAVPRSRVHHNAVEVGRAAPAVAEDSTNVMGLFNVDARYRGAAGEEDAMSAMTGIVSSAPYSRSGGRKPIAAQRFVSTYDGNDPSIKQLLERVYLDNYREPLPELGPHIALGIPRRRALRTSFPPRERTPSRPEGTLIAHLVEHTGAITDIQVAPDQLFFATGSEDGTVKIWDTIRLEKNVTSRSRQTFQHGGRITAVCIVEHSHCVASASDNGTLWIHRVDVSLSGSMPKYGKQQLIRQQNAEQQGDFVTCIASYNTDTTTNLLLGTSLSSIVILDIRTMRTLQTFANPLPFGPISCLCVDRKRVWLVVGTASGTLTLWDLRFGLLLRSWSVTKGRIHKIAVHPCRGKGRWIVVAMEEEGAEEKTGALVAEVWDIDRGVRVEEFKVVSPVQTAAPSPPSATSHKAAPANIDLPSTSAQETTLSPAAALEALLKASSDPLKPRTRLALPSYNSSDPPTPASPRSHPPGVRAFLVGTDYSMQSDARPSTTPSTSGGLIDAGGTEGKKEVGYLMTGGEDRKLRFWDLGRASRSAVISGLEIEDEAPSFSVHTSSTRPNLFLESPPPTRSRSTTSSTRVHRSTLIANSQQQLLRGHQEAITALAVIDLPFRCVVSGDRSGVVKVFE